LTLYLLMQFVAKTLTLLGVVVDSTRDFGGVLDGLLPREESSPAHYQFQAEALSLYATAAFALAWRFLEGERPTAVWLEPAATTAWWAYWLGLGVYSALEFGLLRRSSGVFLDLSRLFSIGAIAVLLGGKSPYALGRPTSWIAIAALVPWYWLALRSGMKGEVGLVSLPILLPAIRSVSFRNAAILACFLTAVVLFVFPFSSAWREANWGVRSTRGGAGVRAVASKVYEDWEADGLLASAAKGTAAWLSRGSTARQGALVIEIAERDGLIGTTLLQGFAALFVPRLLWPDKPTYAPGAWFSWYLGYAETPETATSATGMPLPTELYWSFGLTGVLVGVPLLAGLYFLVWRRLAVLARDGVVPLLALFALLARSAALEDTYLIYAVSSPLMVLIGVEVIRRLQRAVGIRTTRQCTR
jgi:hypothetical protein